MKDFQKTKVYDWEDRHVSCKIGRNPIDLSRAQSIVDYIWCDLGLVNPPKVLPGKPNDKKSHGSTKEIVLIAEHMKEWVLIHELAHSINNLIIRDLGDGHGPNYVADYCFLLVKYYGVDFFYLLHSLKKSGIKINEALYWKNQTSLV